MQLNIDQLMSEVQSTVVTGVGGFVKEVVGLVIHASPLIAPIGSFCEIYTNAGKTIPAGIVGFKGQTTLLMSYGDLEGISQNDAVKVLETTQYVSVGDHLLGRIVDGFGKPIDSLGIKESLQRRNIYCQAPDPLKRPKISEPLQLGIRSIDGLLTIGKGQRVGVFAGTGVGKSVTIGMVAKYSKADVIVICFVCGTNVLCVLVIRA